MPVHASIKAIACVYALLAVALVSHWVYAVMYIGTWAPRTSSSPSGYSVSPMGW